MPIQLTYEITNVGAGPTTTDTPIVVTIYRPLTGTTTITTVPAGFVLTASSTSASQYTATGLVLQSGESVTFVASCTNTSNPTVENSYFTAIIKTGSGGETNGTNNTGGETQNAHNTASLDVLKGPTPRPTIQSTSARD